MNDLPWLLPAPENFNEQCAQMLSADNSLDRACQLAATSLSLNQCNRLIKALDKSHDQQQATKSPLTHFKLGIVSNATFNLFVPALRASALRHGILLDVVLADFDQIMQEALNPESLINSADVDAILIALDHRGYPFATDTLASTTPDTTAADAVEHLNQLRSGFARHSGAPCIVQTLACPPFPLLGGLDTQLAGMLQKEIRDFNSQLCDIVADSTDIMLDIASLASRVGTGQWFDERQWLMSRIAMANEFIPLYCDHVARTLAAMRGKSKKCLILDLDNTLWGGVIGDDGMDGIHIGQGHPVGEAHQAIQRYAKELKNHGIILAICSKNEEAIALQPFREHPDMVLQEEDIAVFVANWNDKASNIQHIARTLNIGTDALVFLDDNPMERDIVRTVLPEVSVPELPDDAALIPRTLAAAGYFDLISFTTDDAQRSEQYRANAIRQKAMESSGNIDDYLASLDMAIEFKAFDASGRKRITQLINKTNQFNLTTRRYTEAEVEQFEVNPQYITRQVRLSDKFGDNGMISVLIAKKEQDCLIVDTWLMSCRVIKRRVEDALCDELVAAAKAEGITTIRGVYLPTSKNPLVKEHYQNLGFSLIDSTDGTDTWELNINDYQAKTPPMSVTRQSPEMVGA